MIFFQAFLVLLFLAVARYLDRENRRVTADNAALRSKLAEAEGVVEEQCRLLALSQERERDANEACVELTRECDAYRFEESLREGQRIFAVARAKAAVN